MDLRQTEKVWMCENQSKSEHMNIERWEERTLSIEKLITQLDNGFIVQTG